MRTTPAAAISTRRVTSVGREHTDFTPPREREARGKPTRGSPKYVNPEALEMKGSCGRKPKNFVKERKGVVRSTYRERGLLESWRFMGEPQSEVGDGELCRDPRAHSA